MCENVFQFVQSRYCFTIENIYYFCILFIHKYSDTTLNGYVTLHFVMFHVFEILFFRKYPALIKWLEGVESSLSDSNIDNQDFSWISLLLSAFLIKSSENAAVHVLNVITTLCKIDPTQVLNILSFHEKRHLMSVHTNLVSQYRF